MNSFLVGMMAFAAMFGGSIAGMYLRLPLPNHHLRDDSRDVVKLAGGLIGTLAALVLGLLVASGKGFYDAQSSELTQMSADIVLLDRTLAHYGPETAAVRQNLRKTVVAVLEKSWASHRSVVVSLSAVKGADVLYDQIAALEPNDDRQRGLKSDCLSMSVSLGRARWLMYEQVAIPLGCLFVMAKKGVGSTSFLSYTGNLATPEDVFEITCSGLSTVPERMSSALVGPGLVALGITNFTTSVFTTSVFTTSVFTTSVFTTSVFTTSIGGIN